MKLFSSLALAACVALGAGCADGTLPTDSIAPGAPRASHGVASVEVVCNTFLSVESERYALPVGASATCGAAYRDASGNLALPSGPTTWWSSAPATVSVSGGTITAHQPGAALISANVDGVTGSVWVDAVASTTPEITTVTVTPTSATLAPDDATALSATAYDQYGNPMSATFSWSSSDPSVATVSAAGTVDAVAVGTATITATTGATSGTATITVATAPLSASILGARQVATGTTGVWSAGVSGGVAPYSYRWYRGTALVSTSSSYSAPVLADFVLQLEVTDDSGSVTTTTALIEATGETNCGGGSEPYYLCPAPNT